MSIFLIGNSCGGSYKPSGKMTSWIILNLLEILLQKKRTSIKSECSKNKVSLSDYESVSKYILNKLNNKNAK